ncbi:hypothetical protein UT300018_15310 [Clostridium faecium]
MESKVNLSDFQVLIKETIKQMINEAVKESIRESINSIAQSEGAKLTLTIAECAKLTGIGREKITELVFRNEIPHFKVGTKTLINRDLLNTWINKISKEGKVL